MFLKQIEIKGFKSFADNMSLNLYPGINIIVGPNGCGKSNIVDAIRWVLGENNIRHLRGLKGEDVIFNGTDTRRSLGMAVVDITIDNSDLSLPLEYSEITLGRKMFRSGESEFYINKTRARLKDVAELFTGTGLGKRGYSIISQGELEQVLNGQPIDRRLILEEASGIIKYRLQRDEAKRRIAASSNDMTRLSDILSELGLHRDELARKADRARIYMQLDTQYRDLERQILHHDICKLLREINPRHAQYEFKQEEYEQNLAELTCKEAILQEEDDKLQQLRTDYAEKKEEIYQAENRIITMQGEVKLNEERVKNHHERWKRAEMDEEKYADLLGKIDQDIAFRQSEFDKIKDEYTDKTRNYQVIESQLNEFEIKIKSDQDIFENKKTQLFEIAKKQSQTTNQKTSTETELRKIREKQEKLEIHNREARNRLKELRLSKIAGEKEREVLRQQITVREDELNKLSKKREVLHRQTVELEQKFQRLVAEDTRNTHNLAAMQDLQDSLAGYSPGVKLIIDYARQKRLVGIIGIIGELMDVPLGLETAIDVAVGRGLENIVVDRMENAREAIEVLKNKKSGRVTFLPLDALHSSKLPAEVCHRIMKIPGSLGIAAHLVKCDARIDKAIEYLLGRVLIMENMDRGIEAFRNSRDNLRIVSLEGELINVSGAITGGVKSSNHSSPLQRKGEGKRLHAAQSQVRAEMADNRRECENMAREIAVIDAELTRQNQETMEAKFKYQMLCEHIKKAEAEINVINQTVAHAEREMEQLARTADDLQREMAGLQESQDSLYDENLHLSSDLDAMRDNIELMKRDYEVCKERYHSHKEQLAERKKQMDNDRVNINQFEQVRNSYQQSKGEAASLQEHLAREIQQASQAIADINQSIQEIHLETELLKRDYEDILAAEADRQQALDIVKQEIVIIKKEINNDDNQIRNLELSIARMETELEGMESKWRELYSDDFSDHGEGLPAMGTMKEYRSSIEVLRQQMADMGAVDLDSIHEYEQVNERYDFLQGQYLDMVNARNSLESLLRETEKLIAEKFAAFIAMANESFRQTFTEIFGGGEAGLRMEPNVDNLEAGIDIEVKMPGKKTQLLSLLSGGERALTCIAFMLSLLRLRPAPFCLLDEIDAALDEPNLAKFKHFLMNMANNIQFLVITHRQAIIETGHNIYGITMPENGVSSVLTLNISEAGSMAG